MPKQDDVVAVIHVAADLVKSSIDALENIWEIQRYECEHFNAYICTMNKENELACAFSTCPYTNYKCTSVLLNL